MTEKSDTFFAVSLFFMADTVYCQRYKHSRVEEGVLPAIYMYNWKKMVEYVLPAI